MQMGLMVGLLMTCGNYMLLTSLFTCSLVAIIVSLLVFRKYFLGKTARLLAQEKVISFISYLCVIRPMSVCLTHCTLSAC